MLPVNLLGTTPSSLRSSVRVVTKTLASPQIFTSTVTSPSSLPVAVVVLVAALVPVGVSPIVVVVVGMTVVFLPCGLIIINSLRTIFPVATGILLRNSLHVDVIITTIVAWGLKIRIRLRAGHHFAGFLVLQGFPQIFLLLLVVFLVLGFLPGGVTVVLIGRWRFVGILLLCSVFPLIISLVVFLLLFLAVPPGLRKTVGVIFTLIHLLSFLLLLDLLRYVGLHLRLLFPIGSIRLLLLMSSSTAAP